MNDYSELERLALALVVHEKDSFHLPCIVAFERKATPEVVLELLAENKRLMAENIALTKTTGAAIFLTLTDELAEIRKKLTAVHFVCDRMPDPDGCRFIELENPQGESLGDEAGKWEIRPDGLAQLVVEIASMNVSGFGEAFYQVAERLGVTGARPISPMQVFASEVLPALDKAIKDAERYRFLRRDISNHNVDFCIIKKFWDRSFHDIILETESADAQIDAAMSKEAGNGGHERDNQLPPGCWEWVVPKGTEAPCRACSGFGTIQTGIDEAPSTICSACEGTGKEKGHDQP